MSSLPSEITEVSEKLSALPGIGPKLSKRLALYLGVRGRKSANSLSDTLKTLVDAIKLCSICGNVTTQAECNICKSGDRDESIVLIVEDSLDLYALEETGEFKGLYHVLGGVISPVNGVGPDDLTIQLLLDRIKNNDSITELIFGLNPNVEGDATSLYIRNEVEDAFLDRGVSFSKLAKGIPVGSDIEYMSSQTLVDSVIARRAF